MNINALIAQKLSAGLWSTVRDVRSILRYETFRIQDTRPMVKWSDNIFVKNMSAYYLGKINSDPINNQNYYS